MSDNEPKKFNIDSYWTSLKGRWVKSEKPVTVNTQIPVGANFKRDLAKGQKAEHNFYMKYQQHLTRTDGRKGDFEINKNGEVLELKTDFYDPKATPNMFIELYSYDDVVGGPFQAKQHGVVYFAYWFPTDDLLYLFNVNQLCKRIKKLEPTLKKQYIKNSGYITTGYLVERSLLEDLCLDPDEVILNGK